ncbi:MAG TPA: wax ester/triacylglycerol synthase family O-acyltransferase, partial [Anaerolineae bacterium]|nr:wax ester/triacylglycerol synthase family O-acyltransferase [Anaerolineae bacterium]
MNGEFFTGVDAAWLRMDRPGNLAQIAGVMIFDKPIERARLIELVHERLLIYDRFQQRVREPLLGLGLPRWEVDPQFDLNYHLPQISLPAPAGQVELQQLVGDLMGQPLDRAHPLWRFYCIDNYQDGCALVPVLHHCIADGLALVQVLLALTDPQPDVSTFQRPASTDRTAVNRSGSAPFRPLTQLIDAASSLTRTAARETLLTLSEPARVTQVASLGALGVNAASKLLLISPDQRTIINGTCGVEKRAAWSAAIPLTDVVRVGRALRGTVNDVLLATATGALRRYMEERGQDVTGINVRAMVPVSIRASKDLNKLGNQFGLIILPLPVGLRDPLQRLHVLKRRMDDIKDTPEALVAFGVLSLMGLTPHQIEKVIIDFFAAKTSAVMTNVPGPRRPIYLAGQRLRSLMFWVPRAGDIGLGLSIISYAGDVYVGIATDVGL